MATSVTTAVVNNGTPYTGAVMLFLVLMLATATCTWSWEARLAAISAIASSRNLTLVT